ncbi:hypothetical protein C3941_02115 [Kaistia algarum]|uniref:DUF4403 family protein n=1 Tax=Kaistia algarum TaxID=2083279 RepID=UPI000CE855B4|nr:DUF4403 family protein [Kaistia algarum]MCX5512986.1 DUF4403 family protein [Kaistia algarum]PPE81527.1 hypothetical protein C3941_02115 [Kaistia algarum]
MSDMKISFFVVIVGFAAGLSLAEAQGGAHAPRQSVDATAPEPSVVRVPIMVPMSAIGATLERLVPVEASGSPGVSLPSPGRDGILDWSLRRTPIAVSGENDVLTARTSIGGTVRLRGNIRIGFKIPFSTQANLVGDAVLTASPVLAPNWTIEPHLSGAATLKKADVNVGHIGDISLRDLLRPSLDHEVDQAIAEANARLAAVRGLRAAAEKVWADLCGPHRIAGEGIAADFYLVIEPVAAGAGSLRITRDGASVTLSLTAFTRLTDTAEQPQCRPLPDLTVPDGDGFTLDVITSARYATLSEQLTRRLADKPLSSPDGALQVRIRAVRLTAERDGVLGAVDFTAGPAGLPALAYSGTAQIQARPVLDASTQILQLDGLALTVGSRDELAGKGPIGDRIGPLLIGLLGPAAKIELAAPLQDSRRNLGVALAQLRAGTVPGLRVTQAEVDDLRIADLTTGKDGLAIRIAARGHIALEAVPAEWFK